MGVVMTAAVHDTFLGVIAQLLSRLPTWTELRQAYTSDALRDGSRYF
jgi:hypothetical protein